MSAGTDGDATGAVEARGGEADDQGALVERTIRWAPGAGALAVAMGLLAVLGLVMFDRSLDRVPVEGLSDEGDTQRTPEDDGATEADGGGDDPDPGASAPRQLGTTLHVLVVGSDDRSVLSAEEQRELHTGDVPGARSEAIAIVRIDPDRDRVDALRFPRDLLVTRCDGSRGRINAAYLIGEQRGIGGASCLVQTIGAWTDIPIHHVVRIDFRGFVDAIDAIGGLDIYVDEPLRDEHAGLDIPAGCVHLDAADALAFVRARHLDDDFGRIQRQQRLVAATMEQVLTADTIRDPRRLGRLLVIARRSLQLDERMTANRLRAIASTVADLDGDDLVTRTVDGEIRRSERGVSYVHPDEEHAETLFQAFVDGELASAPTAPADDASEAAGLPGDDAASGTGQQDGDEGGRDGATGQDSEDGGDGPLGPGPSAC